MAGCIGMAPQFVGRLDGYALAARFQVLQAPVREQVRGQADPADRAEPGQLVTQAGDAGAAGVGAQMDKRSVHPPIRHGPILGIADPLGSGRLQQGVQAHAHGRRQPGVDCGGATVLVGPQRRADDARDAVGGGRLDTERAAPGFGIGSKLNGVAGPGDSVVAQPVAKRLRVGDACLAETEQGAYLSALPLRRAVGSVGQQRFGDARLRHAKGARQLRHRGPVHLGRGAREAAPGAEEQQHDGKAQPVSPTLGLD
jgi:hypothetical protein